MHEFVTDIDLETRATSPTSIDLTTATSGRRPAGALVQGPGVINRWQTRRLNSLNSVIQTDNSLDPGTVNLGSNFGLGSEVCS